MTALKITSLALLILLLCAAPILAAPAITPGLDPEQSFNNDSVTVTITGTGFDPAAKVQLVGDDEATIEPTELSVDDPETITCTFDLTGEVAGDYDVVVTNPNGESDTLSAGFAVLEATPSIDSVDPETAANNETELTLTISGSDFDPDATVQLVGSDETSIDPTDISVDDPETITCTFDLTDEAPGEYDVVVTNSSGESDTLTGGFVIEQK